MRTGKSTAADYRDDTAAQDADCKAGKDAGSVDEHVADFERPARYQLLTKLQCHAQQYHGEGRWDGERPAFDGQERQKWREWISRSRSERNILLRRWE